ncbi:UDP-N-acetylenolpyruvoylglucosamine reductase [Thermaurantimonas aggregans]|uniref:UDP-N-acetylenolpyruvoylglucosamine reductase n=1 Tax=Thermaurantimonas aggregans TaxID=2173829 RepID=A0A401XKY7_9FLAO|nr:UDP-N-acetylmuramate dehydrogenase [Thermaurantimonas aggregans]MCX8148222.1 UDP-N-acetylmuramate dehydrogenase [Thermaurantimonas aggregans]GCD77650.1 UDP-N-acetylenolpyruvoylglucosamine reductase [Thermaurantimonas aggregans]
MEEAKPVPNFSLRGLNTFGLDVRCRAYYHITSEAQLETLVAQGVFSAGNKFLLLGGGSNLLFVNDFFDGVVVHLDLKGRDVRYIDEDYALLTAAAGENWHQTVLYALEQNLGGIENLSLIPGNAGTAPVQNIGAYGVEICEVLSHVEGIDLMTGEKRVLSTNACGFGYRDSVFKRNLKGRFAITSIAMRLTRRKHQLRTHYGTIADELQKAGVISPTIHDISRAVIAIRSSKLPDPAVLGNCGSFFKNPVVAVDIASELKQRYPDMPTYSAKEGVKIPAGWLIEKASWKGKRIGNVGMHERQALVLVNYGDATGAELWAHACRVMDDVREKFGIVLQPEVNVVE